MQSSFQNGMEAVLLQNRGQTYQESFSGRLSGKTRLVNSAMNQAKAKMASLAEIQKTQKTVLSNRVKALEDEIVQKTEEEKMFSAKRRTGCIG